MSEDTLGAGIAGYVSQAIPRQPDDEEIKAAQEATQPYRKLINETPALQSLLYDIDLLPEQIILCVNAGRMIAVCELFKLVPPEAIQKLMTEQPA